MGRSLTGTPLTGVRTSTVRAVKNCLFGCSLARPDWNEYFMGIARAVSRRSDCERDRVGAVVVKARRIRSTGYNGAPSGQSGCSTCPRRLSSVSPGSSYDNCVAVHAEANALLYCDREDLVGATLYITREPCYACSKLIAAAGIVAVVWPVQLNDETRTPPGYWYDKDGTTNE